MTGRVSRPSGRGFTPDVLGNPADLTVTVCGLGYVGLTVAEAAFAAGYRVVAYDRSTAVLRRSAAGDPGISDVAPASLRAMVAGATVFTTSLDASTVGDLVIICVPTPLDADGGPDTSAIEDVAVRVAPHLRAGVTVVLESTTYPGTTDGLLADLLERGSGLRPGVDFHLAMSPERIDPRNVEHTFASTPKVVGGLTERCGERVAAFYASLGVPVVLAPGTKEAELSKLLENTYRFVNISLVNEVALMAERLGIDVVAALECAASKPFGFAPFWPGPGIGGHCIPVDPLYLAHAAETAGLSLSLVEVAAQVNEAVPRRVAGRVVEDLVAMEVPLAAAKVVLMGVTYKPDVADVRESPAFAVVRELRRSGVEASFLDPLVDSFTVDDRAVPPWREAWADVAVLLQPHQGLPAPESVAAVVHDARRPLPREIPTLHAARTA